MADLLCLHLADLDPVDDADENELLESPARAIAALIPDYDPVDELPFYLAEGYLKKKFDELLHPRWPKGTPKGGQFIRKGDVFQADGKKWQVINAVKGRIEAVEASGSASAVEHRVFYAKPSAVEGKGVGIPKIAPATLPKTMGAKSPIVKPYVEPETHDPSIKLPETSKLSAEQWKRFGKEDQEYYVELMDRFGEWSPGVGGSMLNQLHAEYDSQVVHAITSQIAQSTNEYSGSGQQTRMNLAKILQSHGFEGKHGYQNVKNVYDELAEAIHWDLYNRTKAPDITLFHYGDRSPSLVTSEHISGNKPIYAGFSQSWQMGHWSGSTLLMTPTAIRHVHLSFFSGGSNHHGENELASGVRQALDDRSVVFSAANFGMSGQAASQAVSKWIQGETHTTPASGELVEKLKDIWAGKGEIPIPEEPALIKPVAAGGVSIIKPPAEVQANAGALAHKLPYDDGGDGSNKEAAKGILNAMGLKPGDFIEGMQGTRYLIVESPTDSSGGLRYVKIEKNGEVNWNKSWDFDASAGNPFYRLKGHIEIPKEKKKGFAAFTKEQYAKLATGEKKPMANYKPGEMFKVDGNGYKVVGPSSGGQIEIESLDTGKHFTINSLYKGVQLVPTKEFVPPKVEPDFVPYKGQLLIRHTPDSGYGPQLVRYDRPNKHKDDLHIVTTPDGTEVAVPLEDLEELDAASKPPLLPEAGDQFTHNGKKYTVTSILKSGVVRAKPTGGNVEKFMPPGKESDKLPTIGELFRPNDHIIDDKVKAGTLDVGDLVSGSPAKKRPYRVVGTSDDGKVVQLLNMETGQLTTTTKNKSWHRLTKPDPNANTEQPTSKAAKPESTLPPDKSTGEKKALADFEEGERFKLGTGNIYEVTEKGKLSKLVNPDGTYGLPLHIHDALAVKVDVVEPKQTPVSKFDSSKYAEHGSKPVSDLEEGELFLTATGLPAQLKSKKPKGGATAVAMHNGKLIKNIPYDKQVVLLQEKAEQPEVKHEDLSPGDVIPFSALKVGDQYMPPGWKLEDNHIVQVVEEASAADQHAKVALVKASGELGPTVANSLSGDSPITYMGKASPPMDTPDPAVSIEMLDPATEHGFVPYGHHKSGTAKHTKISDLPVTTLFVDKGGTVWKKKSGGPDPVITDGHSNFTADPDAWVKPPDQVPGGLTLADSSMPIAPASGKGAQLMEQMTDSNILLGDLHLAPGDYFTGTAPDGKQGVWQVADEQLAQWTDHLKAVNVDTGEEKSFNMKVHIPMKFRKLADEEGPLAAAMADTLEAGDMFHFAPTPSALAPDGYEVKQVTDEGNIHAVNPETGNSWIGSPADLFHVYGVQKAEPDGTTQIKASQLKKGDAFVRVSELTGKPTNEVYYVTGNKDLTTGNAQIQSAPGNTFIDGSQFGHVQPDETVVKVPVPDWAPPVEAVTPPPKPPPPDAPTSVKGQENVPVPHHLGKKKPANELKPFELALTPGGKFIYKTQMGQLFVLGTKKQSQAKTTLVTPVIPRVSTQNLVNGPPTALGNLNPGDNFSHAGNEYVVLAKTVSGQASFNLTKGQVVFTQPGEAAWKHEVTTRVAAPPDSPVQSVNDAPEGSSVTYKTPDGSVKTGIIVGSHLSDLHVREPQQAPGEFYAIKPYQITGITKPNVAGLEAVKKEFPVGMMVEYTSPDGLETHDAKVTGHDFVGPAHSEPGIKIQVHNPDGSLGGEFFAIPSSLKAGVPVKQPEVKSITSMDIPEGEPDFFPVSFPSHDPDGNPMPGVVSLWEIKNNQSFKDAVGNIYTKLHDGPVQSSVTVYDGEADVKFQMDGNEMFKPHGSGSDVPQEAAEFGDLKVGEKFESHGASWVKTGPTSAKITDKHDPKQMADIGDEFDNFVQSDLVDPPGTNGPIPQAEDEFDVMSLPTWYASTAAPPIPGDNVTFIDYKNSTTHKGTVQNVTTTTNPDTGEEQTTYIVKRTDGYGDLFPLGLEDLVAPSDADAGNTILEPGSQAMDTVMGISGEPNEWSADPSNLEPYLHPKSGSNKYDKIGTLAPGTEFSDKKKGKYRVLAHFGQSTVYEDLSSGKQFVTAQGDRVLVTKAPLHEMKWRFTTAGSVKVYA